MLSTMLRLLCCYLLFGLGQVAHAAKLTSFCITLSGTTPITPLPTTSTSATTTSTRTYTIISTPKTTLTPATITKTKVITSTSKTTTTLPKTTNTYTSFVTHTVSTDSTITSVSSETSTFVVTTTNTDPATASTSPGFTPLASVVAAAGWSPSPSTCQTATPVKRGLSRLFGHKRQGPPPHSSAPPQSPLALPQPQSSTGVSIVATGGSASASPSQYPTEVDCTTLYFATATTTSTTYASTTVTVTPKPSTATITTTSTTTITSSKFPSGVALTTSDVTTTTTNFITTVSTTTNVVTTTSTTYQPASTYYPACDDNNLVGCVNGNDQVAQILVQTNFYQISGPTNPRDCCIACSLDQGCGGSAYYPFQNACYGLIDYPQCNANTTDATFGVAPNGSPITLSNGNCGQWAFKGYPS